MKKIAFLVAMMIFSLNAVAQIEMFDENAKKIEHPKALPYDSLRNINTQRYGSGDKYRYTLHHLIGQTLMYCGDPYAYSFGKDGFEVGAYYRVDSILPDNPPEGKYHRMLLTNIKTGVQLEEGDLSNNNYNFEWVVLGHYEKMKSKYINKDFVYIGTDNVYLRNTWDKANGLINIETDTVTTNIKKGSVWTCVGIQVKPRKKDDNMLLDKRSPIVLIFNNETYGKHYCYLESSNGSPYENLNSGSITQICGRFQLKSQYDKIVAETAAKKAKRKTDLINKFGAANAELILQGKVKIGMTKEMCLEAWGHPEDINKTVGSWGTHEQWVYGSSYLYFEGNKLTSIQN